MLMVPGGHWPPPLCRRSSDISLLRKDSGLVDAAGRRVVGAKGKYPHCPVQRGLTAAGRTGPGSTWWLGPCSSLVPATSRRAHAQFLAKHAATTTGTLACFDRLLFKGHLPLGYPQRPEAPTASRGRPGASTGAPKKRAALVDGDGVATDGDVRIVGDVRGA